MRTLKKTAMLAVIFSLFSSSIIAGRNLPGSGEPTLAENLKPAISLTVDWEICNVGAVHNYITNSTITRSTGWNQWTILIGDDALEYPSMLWTVPEEYADNNHYLYYGSLRLGYHNQLVHLSTDTSPGVDAIEPPNSISDFDTHFYISDQSDLVPPEWKINVLVHQNTYAWDEPEADDFIIYDYWIVNLNPELLDSFYVAFHGDCDVSSAGGGGGTEGFWRDDLVGYYRDYETGEFISYMYDGDNLTIPGDDEGGRLDPQESLGYIGTRLLYCPPIVDETTPSIQQGHAWWDWNNDPDTDADWFALMSDGIWLDPPPSVHDFRYLQKLGPFEIAAEDSINIVFGFGIGEGIDGLRANLEVAQWLFDNGYNPTSVDEEYGRLPNGYSLAQNYPNPFNASTSISFSLLEPQDVKLTVYDLLGREVSTLVDEYRQTGIHHISFDASDLASGIYFYRIQTGESVETRRMVLLK